MPLLSVIVPVYNEEKTLEKILSRIDSVKIDKEIIAVNDDSTDKSKDILERLHIPGLRVISHPKNLGKGAAFRTGLKNARGEIVIIQDADLEYDPQDYRKLIQPILDNQADLALGVRFTKGYKGLFAHQLGNRFLTSFINILYGSRLSDTYTCYKAARREIFNKFSLTSNDFGIDQEIVAKSLRAQLRISEVPIAYHPRSYAEGKKIRYYDAFKVIVQMLKLRLGKV